MVRRLLRTRDEMNALACDMSAWWAVSNITVQITWNGNMKKKSQNLSI